RELLADGGAAAALADDALDAELQHPGRVLVHAAGGGGAGRTDDVAGPFRSGTGVVEDRAHGIEWEGLARVEHLDHALVRGVPGAENGAAHDDHVSGGESAHVVLG